MRRNTEALSRNLCCSVKAIIMTYSECVFVALGPQHAKRMRLIVICACPALSYFSTISHKRLDFPVKIIEHTMCVLTLSATSV